MNFMIICSIFLVCLTRKYLVNGFADQVLTQYSTNETVPANGFNGQAIDVDRNDTSGENIVASKGRFGDSLCFLPNIDPYQRRLVKNGVSMFLPIVVVPGLGGSQLQAIVNIENPKNPLCEEYTLSWGNLWVNPVELLPIFHDCFIDKISLKYDESVKRAVNRDGVLVRAANFGSTKSIESVSASNSLLIYMYLLVSALVEFGYERDVNIRAAPYDFRKAPNDNEEYIYQLKGLIEMTYGQNFQQRIVIICHSMGCIYSLYFLSKMDKHWKDQFIDSYISVAAPFGGAVEAVDEILAGSSLGDSYVPALRTMSGILSLLPTPIAFKEGDMFVKYDNIRNEYLNEDLNEDEELNVNDIPMMLNWLNISKSKEMYDNVYTYREHLVHPGVNTYCYYSSNVSTIERLDYDDANPENTFPLKPNRVYGDGDGTVNIKSLKSCEQFSDLSDEHVFKSFQFKDITHSNMIMHCDVIDSILDTLVEIHKQADGSKHLNVKK